MRGARAGGGRGRGYRARYSFGRWGGWPRRYWWDSYGFGSNTSDSQLVSWAQSCLAQAVGSWVPQTGTLGPATRRAIGMFQAQQSLPANGALDNDTIAALKRVCEGGTAPAGDSGAESPANSGDSQQSMSGEVSNPSLGASGQRTDYAPQTVIDARYTQAVQRRDQVRWTVHPITVKYSSNFDVFAARVAYALGDKLYYRHDGGRNARGLVRATGDLKVIHSLYATGTPPPANGTPIQLNAIFGRRQDPRANMRWVMVIRFNDSHGWGFVDVKDPDVIVVDPKELPRKTMATVLTQARLDCPNLPGNRGKRVCEMISIAERLKYPTNWDLWYYQRSLVDEYVNWRTRNARRSEMSRATGGKFPFDGVGSVALGEWRVYPFREAAIRCSRQGADCKAIVHNTLIHAEDEMLRTFQDIHKMFSVDSAAVFGPLVEEFRKHLVDLLNTPDSLYSAFRKYPS